MGKNKNNKRPYYSNNNNRPSKSPKKHHPSSNISNPKTSSPSQPQPQQQQPKKRPTFSSYLDTPNLPPKVKLLCEIIATTQSNSIDASLTDTGIRVTQADVEQVLKLSYSFPGPSVKFFRWCGHQLNDDHSPYAWNLVVDLLGKNSLFDAMWDAVKSMKRERLLSLATFASIFSSYVIAERVQDAVLTFEVMEQYGIPRDVVALNSLLSAICRDGKTINAVEFLHAAQDRIRPDMDTYAILLEGWENESNVVRARKTFDDMLFDIGWDPNNVPAYDSFLTTLIKAGPDEFDEALKLFHTLREKGCYPGLKFFKVALEACSKKRDARGAAMLWDVMLRDRDRGVAFHVSPDLEMYSCVITLFCTCGDTDTAKKLLDEMVLNGIFPNSKIYNVLFQFMLKSKRLRDATVVFNEMVKNEFVPDCANCALAVRSYLNSTEYVMAIKIWKCMIENYDSDLEETGNRLVVELRDMNRLPEAVKYAEDMIARRIKVSSSTLSKLREGLNKARKTLVYDELFRKWKYH